MYVDLTPRQLPATEFNFLTYTDFLLLFRNKATLSPQFVMANFKE